MRRATWAWLFAAVLLSSATSHASTPKLSGASLVSGQLEAADKGFRAGSAGARIRLEARAELSVEPGTSFRLGAHVELPVPHGATPLVRTRVVIVEQGRIDVSMPAVKRASFACLIVGPGKVQLLVKSGHSTLIARAGGTTVATQAGEALVSKGGRWLRVSEGSMRAFGGDSDAGSSKSLPAAPGRPTLARALLLAANGSQSVTRVSWQRPGDVARYQVRAEHVTTHEERVFSVSDAQLELGGLEPGQYQLMVRSIDDAGLESPWSDGATLNVIGVAVPDSARREDNGALSLLPGQRVRLIGAQGLEVGYAGFDRFMPLPDTLGLVQRRPITAVLRDPDTRESVRLRLEPLIVKAEIELPHAPRRWPTGGLPLTVRLKDQKGRAVLGVHADVQVSVNLEPQALTWTRGEGTWSAVIPSAVGEAPWLVRVNVLDERGVSLGMDFAEIGYESARPAGHARQ
jgi:hypothetical protein